MTRVMLGGTDEGPGIVVGSMVAVCPWGKLPDGTTTPEGRPVVPLSMLSERTEVARPKPVAEDWLLRVPVKGILILIGILMVITPPAPSVAPAAIVPLG